MANEKQIIENKLAHLPIGKLLWDYSVPAIVGTMVMSLYNIVDRIFIGQGVGALAISGLALTFPFMNFLMAFGMLIGVGAAARISICLGQNDHEKSEKILANAAILTFIISGSVIILSLIFMKDILLLFGGSEKTVTYADQYMRIIIPATIISTFSYSFNNIIRATGYPKKAMYTMFIGAGINVILDPLFIFVFKWGIEGAAIATAISMTVSCAWVMLHFFKRSSLVHFQKKNFVLDRKIIGSILSIGVSPFSMQIAMSAIIVITNYSLIKYGGDLAVGAYGILSAITMLIVMFIIGLNQGSQPIIGYNFGAKYYDRMFHTLKLSAIVASLISTIGFIGGMFFPHALVSVFTHDKHLQDLASEGLRISVMIYPLVGAMIIFANFFQSTGHAKIAMFLSLTRQVLFLIPLLLILPPIFGLKGVWYSMPASDFISCFVTSITLYVFVRKFKRKNTPTAENVYQS